MTPRAPRCRKLGRTRPEVDLGGIGSPTGTPGGAAFEEADHVWLKPGDRMELEISTIGTLEKPIAAE